MYSTLAINAADPQLNHIRKTLPAVSNLYLEASEGILHAALVGVYPGDHDNTPAKGTALKARMTRWQARLEAEGFTVELIQNDAEEHDYYLLVSWD